MKFQTICLELGNKTLAGEKLDTMPEVIIVVNNLVPHNRSGEIFSRQESSVEDDNYYYNNNISESAYNDNEEYERNNFRGEQQSSIDLVARSCHPWNVPFDNRLHHKVEKGYASEILVYKVAHYLIVDFPSRNFFFFFFF